MWLLRCKTKVGRRGHTGRGDVERGAGERRCTQKDGKTAVVRKHIDRSYIPLRSDNCPAFGLQPPQGLFGKAVQSQKPNKDACVETAL